jgi:hypothetical protein
VDRFRDVPHAGLLFRHPDGVPLDAKWDQQSWRELLARAGLIAEEEAVPGGTTLTTHVARHTLVTALRRLGVSYELIGDIAGTTRRWRETCTRNAPPSNAPTP